MGDAPGRAQWSTFCTYLQRVRHEPATRWNQSAPECWKLLRLLQHKSSTRRAVRPWRQPLLPLLLQLGWQLTLLQLWLLKAWSPLGKQQATHASCHGVFWGGQQRMHWPHPVNNTTPEVSGDHPNHRALHYKVLQSPTGCYVSRDLASCAS